jgi:hypothetical protein
MSTLPNLRKAYYAQCFWRNQQGTKVFSEDGPKLPTHNGTSFDPQELVDLGAVQITRLEHAKRLGGPDRWTFYVTIHFPSDVTIDVSGDNAVKIWKAWKGVVYGQTNT